MTKTVEETAQCLFDTHIPNLSHEDTQEQGVIRRLARIAPKNIDITDAPFFTGEGNGHSSQNI